MRDLRRNKRRLYWSVYTGKQPIMEEIGGVLYETGEYETTYSEPQACYANVSAGKGEMAIEVFGQFTDYTRTITIAGPACPIAEGARIWFGSAPPAAHNYIVTRRADSINGVLLAIREVLADG